MTNALLAALAVLMLVNIVGTFFVLIFLPDPSSQELDRLRRESELADDHMTRITKHTLQAMLDEAIGEVQRFDIDRP
jgi:hypothetical protein